MLKGRKPKASLKSVYLITEFIKEKHENEYPTIIEFNENTISISKERCNFDQK